jgi:hypothetical protein
MLIEEPIKGVRKEAVAATRSTLLLSVALSKGITSPFG